jgi:putative transposase
VSAWSDRLSQATFASESAESDKRSLKKATMICLLVVLGTRADGQKVLLAVKNMGGETARAWRVVLDDLIKRGLRKSEFLIVDGGSGLERALAELWSDVPTQRCTVHKHRNLLAHALKANVYRSR